MEWSTVVNLDKSYFSEKEKVFAVNGEMCASTFVYDSGVHGLRIKNKCGSVVMLPYQGQQIWSCNFYGRELAMRSTFKEPVATKEYLETYGGFLLHCGALAMGVPSKEDSHPLHGELPNAPYQTAFIQMGSDEKGSYIGLGGQYRHRIGFNHNYIAEPFVKVYEDSSVMDVSMSITNMRQVDMEHMYLMHINFKPETGSSLVYSAHCNPKDVRVHVNIPCDGPETGKLGEFLNQLVEHPELHNVLTPELVFDPEIVFTLRYSADEMGKAYSLQIHPDGYACFVSHCPSELEYGIRWIARTGDEDAMGLVLPATAENRGYTAEKKKGNIKLIPAGERVSYHVQAGLLMPKDALEVKNKINEILLVQH